MLVPLSLIPSIYFSVITDNGLISLLILSPASMETATWLPLPTSENVYNQARGCHGLLLLGGGNRQRASQSQGSNSDAQSQDAITKGLLISLPH